jgi:elongation factor Ts
MLLLSAWGLVPAGRNRVVRRLAQPLQAAQARRALSKAAPAAAAAGDAIPAALVKELRERTGSPMMECKKALADPEVKGDLRLAAEWLRRQGVKMAAKKMDRQMNDGLVGLQLGPRPCRAGALVEVSSETDFVARNEQFQKVVQKVASAALGAPTSSGTSSVELLLRAPLEGGETVAAALTRATATIGENIALKNCAVARVSHGAVGAYVHNARGEGVGTMASLVAVEAAAPLPAPAAATLATFADSLAMHLVGGQANFLDGVPSEVVARERDIELERLLNEARETAKEGVDPKVLQQRAEKKADKIVSKMQDEEVLLNQQMVSSDPQLSGIKVSKALAQLGKQLGTTLAISAALRFRVGAEKQALLLPTPKQPRN